MSLKHQNSEAVTIKLLNQLGSAIPAATVADELYKHPDYSSLLAISDVLNTFHIDNAAIRIEADELSDVPVPFIAHTRIKGGDFLLVNAIKGDWIYVSSETADHQKMKLSEFVDVFTGTVLGLDIEGDLKAGRNSRRIDFSRLKTPLVACLSVIFLLTAIIYQSTFFNKLDISLAALCIIKIFGIATSILLLIQSFDTNNHLIQKICSGNGKVNCNAILSSSAAMVFKGLSWSEVGFFYFAGTWLTLLFVPDRWAVNLLAILNLLCIPYPFYSIYYQAMIAKQWCVLCCTVQALLVLEFAVFFIWLRPAFHNLFAGFQPAFLICLSLPALAWLFLKPLIANSYKLEPLTSQLRQLKFNKDLFNRMVVTQPRYTTPGKEWSIVLGEQDAQHVITMVSNPYCGHCATTHDQLKELLSGNKNLQARIVFSAKNSNEDIKTPVSRHFMALNQSDTELTEKALHDWYKQKKKNYDRWSTTYPVLLEQDNAYHLDKQKDWCEIVDVRATPMFLLNGYLLPDLYQISDLKYMLD